MIGIGLHIGNRVMGGGFDVDAQAFFDRVTAAGGTLTATEQTAVNTLVLDLKANSLWTPIKALYPMVGASAAACAQNLKSSSFTGTFTSGWTFASTGVKGNGTSAYFNTNFDITNLQQNNNSIGFYSRSNTVSTHTEIGIAYLLSYAINMGANYSGFGAFARNFNTSTSGFPNGDTRGLYVNSRIISTENKMYKNNSLLGTNAFVSNTPVSGINIAIGGEMQIGNASAAFFSNKEFALGFMGDGLNATQNTNFYTAVQAFQTTLLRQV